MTELIHQRMKRLTWLKKTFKRISAWVANDENAEPAVCERAREKVQENVEKKKQLVNEKKQLGSDYPFVNG